MYNIADDDALSTNDLIRLIANSNNKIAKIWKIHPFVIVLCSKIGDFFYLPFNSNRLKKLTQNFVISNGKIKNSMQKSLPVTSREGLLKTFKTFKIK